MTTQERMRGEAGDGVDQEYLQSRKERIIAEVRSYAHETFNNLHAASREETEALLRAAENLSLNTSFITDWEQFIDSRLPEMAESAHRLYHEEFMDAMLRAYNETPRIISLKSIGEWDDRFKRESVHYKQREAFVHNKLPTYVENWRKVAHQRQDLLKNATCKQLTAADVPDIATFHDEEAFLNLHYRERVGLCAMVRAAMAAGGSRMEKHYNKAKSMLQNAANDGVIAKDKVGTWLERIFESKADPALIEAFVEGKGKLPLTSLINRWRSAAEQFDVLSKKANKRAGPSFTFITKKKFLNMHYESRLAYLQEAECRLKDREIASVPSLLLDIRRELDARDWDSAEHLIAQAKGSDLSPDDARKVRSMENYLRTQRKEHGTESGSSEKDPQAELDALIGDLPGVVQPLFAQAAKRGERTMRCLKALWFNRDWCRQHGHLDDQREELLRQRSRKDTEQVVKQGHGKEYENNTLEYGQPAVRQYRGAWAPQILHFNPGGEGPLLNVMEKEASNHAFKYWSTLLPRGVDFATHSYILYSVFPKLMRCVRSIEEQRHVKKAA